ncbi:N4-gp56 family major capsid protein [Sphingomonas sp.]|uniref:N4-gp56 family major capsid protein n=1 Tax=Sphingomonas sp. TaxID=28214 RepID=UPI00307E1348
MSTTTYGDISQRTAAFAAANMLSHAEPVLVLSKFGQTKPIPRNKAETVKFRRPIPFEPATVPLAEGVTPTPHRIAYEDVPVTLKQWGDLVEITDKVADLSEDPVLSDATMLAGEQAGATVEQVIYGVVKAGTSVFYANGASRAAVNTAPTLNKQRAVVRYLNKMKAKKFTRILSGSVQIGTQPVEAAYVAITHTDLEADIRSMTGFVPVAKYGTRQPLCDQELGTVENVRYVVSPDLEPWEDAGGAPGSSVLSTSGSAADVYPIIYLGMEAYGLTPLKGKEAVTPTVINPGTIDKADPLGQRGYVGWKTWFQAVRLNETWMARLECAATKL